MASIPTPRKARSSTPSGTDSHAIMRWINAKLARRNMQLGEGLVESLKSGILLYHLLEELSGDSLAEEVGKLSKGTTRHHHLSNVSLCLRYLESAGVPLVNIGAIDVVDGNESSVLGLLWRIKQHFFAAADEISDNVEGDDNNDNSDFNVSPTKQQFLTWLKHRVQDTTDPATGSSLANAVHDVTESLANGTVLLAILHNFATTTTTTAAAAENEANSFVAPVPTGDPAIDFETAVRGLHERFGVPPLLLESPEGTLSDEVALSYLQLLKDHAPKRSGFSPPRGPFTMFPGSPTSYPTSPIAPPLPPSPSQHDEKELPPTPPSPPNPFERIATKAPINGPTNDAAGGGGRSDVNNEAGANDDSDVLPQQPAVRDLLVKARKEEQVSEMETIVQEEAKPLNETTLQADTIASATAAASAAATASVNDDINVNPIKHGEDKVEAVDVVKSGNNESANETAIERQEMTTVEQNAPGAYAAPAPPCVIPPSYGSPRGEDGHHLVEDLPGSPSSCISADLLASPLVSGLLVVAGCVNNASPNRNGSPSHRRNRHRSSHSHAHRDSASSSAPKPSRKLNWRPDLPVYEWKRVAFADDECTKVKSLDLARCNLQLDLADLPIIAALAPDGPVEVLRLSRNLGLTGDLRTLVQPAPAPIPELHDQHQEADVGMTEEGGGVGGEDNKGMENSSALLLDPIVHRDAPGGSDALLLCPVTPSVAGTGERGGQEEAVGSTVGATGDAVRPHKSPHKSPVKTAAAASPVPISPSAVSSLSSNSVSGEEDGRDDLDDEVVGGDFGGLEREGHDEVDSELLTGTVASSTVNDGSPPCALQVLWLNGTSIGGSLRHLARAHLLRHCYLGNSTATTTANDAACSGSKGARGFTTGRHSQEQVSGFRGDVGVFVHCPLLVRLSLANCGPRVQGDFAPVAHACTSLEDLELHGTNVAVDLVACFGRDSARLHSSGKRDKSSSRSSGHRSSRGRRLRRLSVSGPLVSGDVVAGLGGCYRLEDLRLPHTQCTGDLDAAVSDMAAIQHRAAGPPACSNKNAHAATSPYSPMESSGARCRLTWLNIVGSSELVASKEELLQTTAKDCSIFGAS